MRRRSFMTAAPAPFSATALQAEQGVCGQGRRIMGSELRAEYIAEYKVRKCCDTV